LGVDRSTNGRIREVLGIEPRQAQIIGMLPSREFVTRDGLYTVLYEGLPECEWPDEKILDVQICKLRVQLKQRDADRVQVGQSSLRLEIKTKWGEGWLMSREDKAKGRPVTVQYCGTLCVLQSKGPSDPEPLIF
jgi:hypothetical protein